MNGIGMIVTTTNLEAGLHVLLRVSLLPGQQSREKYV